MASARQWIQSLLFFTLTIASLYLLDTLMISSRLTTDYHNIQLKKQPQLPLRFRSDGTFKILQVADMYYGNGMVTRCRDVTDFEFNYCSDLNTTQFLRKMIDIEKPDLVVFTGDNIFGTSATDATESLFEVFAPAIESRIPWAAVLGNHDQNFKSFKHLLEKQSGFEIKSLQSNSGGEFTSNEFKAFCGKIGIPSFFLPFQDSLNKKAQWRGRIGLFSTQQEVCKEKKYGKKVLG